MYSREKLKKFRKEKHITQKDLAQKSGISYSMVTKLETGEQKNPSLRTLSKIASALDIPVSDLFISKETFSDYSATEFFNQVGFKFEEYLSSLGFEYVPNFYENDYGYDRLIHIKEDDQELPLTGQEYLDLKNNTADFIESQIYKLRKQKHLL